MVAFGNAIRCQKVRCLHVCVMRRTSIEDDLVYKCVVIRTSYLAVLGLCCMIRYFIIISRFHVVAMTKARRPTPYIYYTDTITHKKRCSTPAETHQHCVTPKKKESAQCTNARMRIVVVLARSVWLYVNKGAVCYKKYLNYTTIKSKTVPIPCLFKTALTSNSQKNPTNRMIQFALTTFVLNQQTRQV